MLDDDAVDETKARCKSIDHWFRRCSPLAAWRVDPTFIRQIGFARQCVRRTEGLVGQQLKVSIREHFILLFTNLFKTSA